MNQGYKSNQKIDFNLLTKLLLKAQKIDWKGYYVNVAPKPPVHDGQTLTISAWKDGVLYRIQDPELNDENSPLSAFIKLVNELLVTNQL